MAGAIDNWDADKPAGTDYIDASDQLIRANWEAIEVMTGGTLQNLKVSNGASPSTQVKTEVDRIGLFNTDTPPLCYVARSVNLTADIESAVGPNGPENSTLESADKWIYIWVIYNPSTDVEASVLSASNDWSSVVKTDISGYTFARLVGAVYNDASGNFRKFLQRGNRITYKSPRTSSGLTNLSQTSWTSVDISDIVPPDVKRVFGYMHFGTSFTSGGPYWGSIRFADDTSGSYEGCRIGGATTEPSEMAYWNFEQELTDQNLVYRSDTANGQFDVYITSYHIEI